MSCSSCCAAAAVPSPPVVLARPRVSATLLLFVVITASSLSASGAPSSRGFSMLCRNSSPHSIIIFDRNLRMLDEVVRDLPSSAGAIRLIKLDKSQAESLQI
jgi:hypothetical protein